VRLLAIQFACQKQQVRRFGAVTLGIGLFALAAGALHFNEMRALARETEALTSKMDEDARRTAAAQKQEAPRMVPEASVRAMNDAIAKLNLPWRELFAALESARPDNIALLALEPDGRKRTLLVQAESRAPEHMIVFVERLRSLPAFDYALLVRHELREQDPNRPYRFIVELRWREET
jgi:hypothetical protein